MKSHYVIFADDDADDLELITSLFKEFNRKMNVLEFRDGKDTLKFLNDSTIIYNRPLLIVMDINMPRMDGKETLAAIRSHKFLGNIPVIIYTTSVSKEDQEFCNQHNASWVNKPFNIEEAKVIAKIMADFCYNAS
jgi:CheY-like chemotaxis protein